MSAEIETPSVPNRLYRYRPLANTVSDAIVQREVDAIIKAYIWCGDFEALNDAMEGITKPSSMLSDDESLYQHQNESVYNAMKSLGVASFSESYMHDPMWAHYANNFNGMCISYKFRTLLLCLPKKASFVRVSYSDQAPLLPAKSINYMKAAKTALSTKNPRWLPEREWRLFATSKGQLRFRYTACIDTVYLGARVSKDVRRHIRKKLTDADRNIVVKSMSVEGYDMKFRVLKHDTIDLI